MAEFYRLHSQALLTHLTLIVGDRALAGLAVRACG